MTLGARHWPLSRILCNAFHVALCGALLAMCLQAQAAGQERAAKSEADKSILVQDSLFHSSSLGRDMHYRVLFPRDYEKGGRFPVLYLLHGLYGDYQNWDTRTGLESYARNLRWLIVMPDADNSWYTNSVTVPADRFEDYIVKDLIAETDDKYRTIRDQHARAIAGLSMGGYAAVKFSLKYPELFGFAGSLSGALNAAENLDDQKAEFREKLLAVFGDRGGSTRRENDVFLLLNNLSLNHPSSPNTTVPVSRPYLYIACGTSDFFLETNREFIRQLQAKGLAYEYHETPGGHAWDYWDGALKPLLGWVSSLDQNSTQTGK
jgi:putative tributyrin esterase